MGLVGCDFFGGEGGEGVRDDGSRIPLLRRASEVRFCSASIALPNHGVL